MVRDVSHENIRHELGLISISVDDLIKILESKGIQNVTAKTRSIEFESLDDIKTHKALLAGRPTIYLDEVWISFESGWSSVSPRHNAPNGASLAKSIYEDLINYKSALDKLAGLKIFKFPYLLIFVTYAFLGKWIEELIIVNQHAIYAIRAIFLLYFLMFLLGNIWMAYAVFFRKTVYHRPVEGFFRKNNDKIALAVITGLISGIIGIVIGKFGGSVVDKIVSLF
ncbi:hypothetical protein [Rhizobium lusitanum]|uniref:Uncharacterized protein n=1 Tax=Rhizobium lusitanum TaxID=293958 RepID=A0A7X0MFH7_9HYPH|nr:hypothetical protein [Rhizobium lusitanum]MBB6488769.1 hypothetical protein [Rhizobium lusitanum]